MNLVKAFETSVHKQPLKVALYWGERECAYKEFWQQSLSVAEHLDRELGVKAGDRVGLWLKNCPEFIPAFFGILHLGAVVVPINNFFKSEEVGHILRDAGVDVIITDAELAAHLP